MAVTEHPPAETTQPGWFTDPLRQHNLRYFDGADWTDHVTHYGPTPCRACAGHPSADSLN